MRPRSMAGGAPTPRETLSANPGDVSGGRDAWQGFSREIGLSDPSTATRRSGVGRQQQQHGIKEIKVI